MAWMTYLASDMGILLFKVSHRSINPRNLNSTLLNLKQRKPRWRCARDAGYGMHNAGKGAIVMAFRGMGAVYRVLRQP